MQGLAGQLGSKEPQSSDQQELVPVHRRDACHVVMVAAAIGLRGEPLVPAQRVQRILDHDGCSMVWRIQQPLLSASRQRTLLCKVARVPRRHVQEGGGILMKKWLRR